MKALVENGEIVSIYQSLPNSLRTSTKYILGGANNLSEDQLEALGIYDVENPDGYDARIHNLTDLTFDSENSVCVYSKENKTWSETLAELKVSKISSLKSIYNLQLSKTDWIIIRDSELGNTTEQSVKDARAALRSECASKEAEINALTTKANVITYQLPNFDV